MRCPHHRYTSYRYAPARAGCNKKNTMTCRAWVMTLLWFTSPRPDFQNTATMTFPSQPSGFPINHSLQHLPWWHHLSFSRQLGDGHRKGVKVPNWVRKLTSLGCQFQTPQVASLFFLFQTHIIRDRYVLLLLLHVLVLAGKEVAICAGNFKSQLLNTGGTPCKSTGWKNWRPFR